MSALPTAAEHFAMERDVAIVCVAFHTMKREFELWVAVAAQVSQIPGGDGVHFQPLVREYAAKIIQTVVVKMNADCRDICAVAAMVD